MPKRSMIKDGQGGSACPPRSSSVSWRPRPRSRANPTGKGSPIRRSLGGADLSAAVADTASPASRAELVWLGIGTSVVARPTAARSSRSARRSRRSRASRSPHRSAPLARRRSRDRARGARSRAAAPARDRRRPPPGPRAHPRARPPGSRVRRVRHDPDHSRRRHRSRSPRRALARPDVFNRFVCE
jgi:hypothetical protein